jgi:hypothetical protein
MKVWRLSCYRPLTPTFVLMDAQTVLNEVHERVGSVGWGLPKGNTNHSGRVSWNFFRNHLECSTITRFLIKFVNSLWCNLAPKGTLTEQRFYSSAFSFAPSDYRNRQCADYTGKVKAECIRESLDTNRL